MKTLLMFILSAAVLVAAPKVSPEAKMRGEAQRAVQAHISKHKLGGQPLGGAAVSVELVRPQTGWENRWVVEGVAKFRVKAGSSSTEQTRRFTVILLYKDNKVEILDVSV